MKDAQQFKEQKEEEELNHQKTQGIIVMWNSFMINNMYSFHKFILAKRNPSH